MNLNGKDVINLKTRLLKSDILAIIISKISHFFKNVNYNDNKNNNNNRFGNDLHNTCLSTTVVCSIKYLLHILLNSQYQFKRLHCFNRHTYLMVAAEEPIRAFMKNEQKTDCSFHPINDAKCRCITFYYIEEVLIRLNGSKV